jgi:glycosyltransferase involved in cell wall biosynthesis
LNGASEDHDVVVTLPTTRRIALFMPSFRGGGAERVLLTLAQGLAEQNMAVDLVVAQNEGSFVSQIPPAVRVVDLKARRVLTALPGLVRYLRQQAPHAMLSALPHANVVSVWARSLAKVATRLVLSEHTTASFSADHAPQLRARLLPIFMRRAYRRADAIVAVSEGAADDLAALVGLERSRITRIYNPVVTPRLFALAAEPLEHPWFGVDQPPVILGAGRLTPVKDFETLIRAFAILRPQRKARLMILGEGDQRSRLQSLIEKLGIAADATLPGFVTNPYKYMRRSSMFVLSSRWEGFGNVLVEAMACGAPVISTDCPGGPAEILEGGCHGRLVSVGDHESMALAILAQLDGPPILSGLQRARSFTLESSLRSYRRALAV